jgi:hypothetical protein
LQLKQVAFYRNQHIVIAYTFALKTTVPQHKCGAVITSQVSPGHRNKGLLSYLSHVYSYTGRMKVYLSGCVQRPGVYQLLQQQMQQQAWCRPRHKHRCRDSSLLNSAAATSPNQPDALQQQQLQDPGLGQQNAHLQPSHVAQQQAEQQQSQLQLQHISQPLDLDQQQLTSQQEPTQQLTPAPPGQHEPQLHEQPQQQQQEEQQQLQQQVAQQQREPQRSALPGQPADQQSPQQARLQLLQRMLVFMVSYSPTRSSCNTTRLSV